MKNLAKLVICLDRRNGDFFARKSAAPVKRWWKRLYVVVLGAGMVLPASGEGKDTKKTTNRTPQASTPTVQKAASPRSAIATARMQQQQPRHTSTWDTEKAVIIKLRIHRANKAEGTAAGLYIGKDQQNAYFITACHAVVVACSEGTPWEGVAVNSIQLQFNSSPQGVRASVFEHYDPVLDLAVVQTAVANLPSHLRQMERRDAAVGLPVHIIGHPAAGEWSVSSGTVLKLSTPSGDIHHFTIAADTSVAEGDSGGPVFDSDGGFLGMHTATGPSYGIEAKSSDIVDQLKAWSVPTDNLTEAKRIEPAGMSAAEVAINRVLNAYEDAYNRQDAESLWKIWPDAPATTRKKIEGSFKQARTITMRVTDRQVDPSGSAKAQYSQIYVPKNGAQQKSNGAIGFELRKTNGAWIIASVK